MNVLKRILVATDFSKKSESVIENAIDMAKAFGSEIALTYIIPGDVGSKKAKDLLYGFAEKQLKSLNESIEKRGVATLNPILEVGDFSEKIIESSEKLDVNILFAGAGEKLGDNIPLLGSNAVKIIKKSNKPVFIVKNDSPLNINKILCPIDFSLESKRALKNAITLAHKFNAEIIILNVYDLSDLFPIRNKIKMDEHLEYLQKNCENELNEFLKDFTYTGLNVTKEIKQGKPATEILKAIKRHEIDLLIMGTTGKSGINKILLGSVTEKVIKESTCSFITLKKEDAIILDLEAGLKSIDHHYELAQQLYEDRFFEESIAEYNKCLNINFLHIPSMRGLSKIYKKLGDTINENKYKSMVNQVSEKMDYNRIESEIRKNRT